MTWAVRIKGWNKDILNKPETPKAVEELAAQIASQFPKKTRPLIKAAFDFGIVFVECDDVIGAKLGQLPGAENSSKVKPHKDVLSIMAPRRWRPIILKL